MTKLFLRLTPKLPRLLRSAVILAACAVTRSLRGYWVSLTMPVAAVAAALCSPLNYTAGKVQTIPVGVLAIVGSFALLGIGALAALTKPRWHPHRQPHDS